MQYGEILKQLMRKKSEIVVLTTEARQALLTIPKEFPDRFYDFGIAEQNMVGAAAGMAAMGMVPVIHAPLAAFITMRSFEHVRTMLGMQNRNVKIPGLLPGFAAGFQGPTHVALEDISLMRGIPGMVVMEAASEEDLEAVMRHAFSIKACVYFRIAAEMPKKLDCVRKPRNISEPRVLREGQDGLIITSGGMASIAVQAAQKLAAQGLDLTVIYLCLLDPSPRDDLLAMMAPHKQVAVIEEHFVTGGLGSIMAEIIADAGLGKQLLRVGVNDAFPDRYTRHMENLAYIGLDAHGISKQLTGFFKK